MAGWNEYKKTYRSESDIFDFAREGDLRGFAALLSQPSLLDLDALNHKGYSALMLAVYNGQQDFCEALLRGGADVNSKDLMENTVLMAAAFKGDLALLQLLLDYGANIKDVNQSRMNARDWALMFGRTEVIKYLDKTFPDEINSSKTKSIFKFIKLAFIMLKAKVIG